MAGGSIQIANDAVQSITNKSHAVLAGQTILNGRFASFDATTADEVRPSADTVGERFAGLSAGVYEAGEFAEILLPRYIVVTDSSAALVIGATAYISDTETVKATGNVPVGVVRALDIDGVAARVLVETYAAGMATGGAKGVVAMVGQVVFGVETNVTFGIIPANAIIVDWHVNVETVFDDAGTNLLVVGWTVGDADELVDDLDLTSAATSRAGSGATLPDLYLGKTVGASDRTIYGKFTGQNPGTAAAGAATVVITYILP